MGYLRGYSNYLIHNYRRDVFGEFFKNQQTLEFHIAGHKKIKANIAMNKRYDVVLNMETGQTVTLPKVRLKFFYSAELSEKVKPLITIDEQIRARNLQPIFNPTRRFHVKNKNLYPMMMLKMPITITLLEGEVLEGLITDFTMYEIFLELAKGVQIVLLRHAIYNAIDKTSGRNLLKRFQEKMRDWEKTPLWIEEKTED